jgi:hypothetical protein
VSVLEYPSAFGTIAVLPTGIVHTSYAANGNDRDIARIDPDSGVRETVITGVREPRLVTISASHVLFGSSVPGTVTYRLVLRDRQTGVEARSIRLRDRVLWARIAEDHVLVWQPDDTLTFSVPDMKLMRKAPTEEIVRKTWSTIYGDGVIRPWGNKLVVAANELVVFDQDFGLLARHPIAHYPARNGVICRLERLLIDSDTAFVEPGCGIIRAIDLNSGATKFEIDVGSRWISFAVLDGILYVAETPDSSVDRMQMFDANSGMFLGVLPGMATAVAAGKHRLVLLQDPYVHHGSITVTVYEPDVIAIRDRRAGRARLLEGCKSAASTGRIDLYRAIDECEAAGVRGFIERLGVEAIDADVRVLLARYAERLAQTYSRFAESAPILEKLGLARDHVKTIQAVEKQTALVSTPADEPSTLPLPPGAQEVELYHVAKTNRYFIGEYMIEAANRCDGEFGSITLRVFNRSSMGLLAEVPILDCSNELLEAISSVDVADDYVVVGLASSLSTPSQRVALVRLPNRLVTGNERVHGGAASVAPLEIRLIRCTDSEEIGRHEAALKSVAIKTKEACRRAESLSELGEYADVRGHARLQTESFVLTRSIDKGSSYRYDVRAISGLGAPFSFRSDLRGVLVHKDSDTVIFQKERLFATRLVALDLESGEQRTLVELGNSSTWGPVERWGNYLFIAHGRDLMTLDLVKQEVVGYEKNLVRGGLVPVCLSCNDGNGIRQIIFDGDRLFALTLGGRTSIAIDLPEYIRSLETRDPAGAH